MQHARAIALACLLGIAACEPAADTSDADMSPAESQVVEQPADTHRGLSSIVDFPIGVAVPADPWENSLLGSPERQALTERHFNSITAENAMKMQYLHPSPGEYDFEAADALVEYAAGQDMIVHGHALVWHNQAPQWMNEFEGSPGEFQAILDEHVRTVAAHFAGRLESWDVVNEAFTDDHPSDYRATIWYENIGESYIEQAFVAARESDPDADLYYNDYNISGADGPDKLDRVLIMVDDFLERGVPIDGVGFQVHIELENPPLDDIRAAFEKVVERGLKVRVSELDISVNSNEDLTELTEVVAAKQAQRYADIARIYQQAVPPELRGGITIWGITDGDSWIPGFRQRPDWPLLFNADFSDKPALEGFARGLAAGADAD